MRRFFTKKSVVIILATVLVVGFFSFNFTSTSVLGQNVANAQDASVQIAPPTPPKFSDSKNQTWFYLGGGNNSDGNGNWHNQTTAEELNTVKLAAGSILTDKNDIKAAKNYDVTYRNWVQSGKTNNSKSGWEPLFDLLGNSAGQQTSMGTVGEIIFDAVIFLIERILIPIAAFLVSISGTVMDFSIQYTIFGQGLGSMNASIQSVWTLIRDTANVLFIFILLYAAIKQIIFAEAAKKMLTSIIISAVLINFSLFFTNIAIDASNLIATAIHNQIVATTNNASLTSVYGVDLSGRIMDGLNLTTLYSASAGSSPNNIVGIAGLLNSVTRLVLFAITFWVFIMLAGLLIGRYVMLIILMITSPIGFVGDVVPYMGEYATKWRNNLTNLCIMAPIFMFLMLLTIRLSQILAATKPTNPFVIFFNFFLVVYLLLNTVKKTKELSGDIGEYAGKLASMATGATVAYATGGASILAQQTIGRGANAFADSSYGKRLETYKGVGSFATKGISSAIKGTAKSAFDVRNTGAFKETMGQIKGISGMSIMDEGSLKATGGDYGKYGTGYAGLVKKTTEEASAEAKAAEKTSREYEQSIVDRNPKMVEEYKAKQEKEAGELRDELNNERDPIKKEEIQKKLTEAEQIYKGEKLPSARDVIESHYSDFTTAQSKIDKFKKSEEELLDTQKKLDDELKNIKPVEQKLMDAEKAAQDELDDIIKNRGGFGKEKAAETLKKATEAVKAAEKNRLENTKQIKEKISNGERDIEILKREHDVAQQAIKTLGRFGSAPSEVKAILTAREARKQMIENYRGGILDRLNTLRGAENRDVAGRLERETPTIASTTEEKRLAAEAKARVKAQKEYERDNPGSSEPSSTPTK